METAQPARSRRRLEEIKPPGVQDLVDVNARVIRLEHFGGGIEHLQQGSDALARLLVHRLDLVDDDHVGELDLVHHQVRYRALVLRDDLFAVSVGEEFRCVEVREQVEGINDRDSGVEFGERMETAKFDTVADKLMLGSPLGNVMDGRRTKAYI